MPDIHDMELDARITEAEICEHKDKTYQPYEYDTNINCIFILSPAPYLIIQVFKISAKM